MKHRIFGAVAAMLMIVGMVVLAFSISAFAVGETVEISNTDQLSDAIANQKEGQTWVIKPGTYTLTQADLDKYADWKNPITSSQTDRYFPIYVKDITIIGETGENGERVVLTSDVVRENGVWASQDFISVWADGVTIENVDIMSKQEINKAVEVMAKDFTLKNCEILPYENEDKTVFSGSVYFNTADIGTSLVQNVTMYAWINARAVTTGTVVVDNLVQDFSNNEYAGFSTPENGYAWKPGVSGTQVEIKSFTIKVDGKSNFTEQVIHDELKPGTTIVLTGNIEVDEMVNINKDDITLDLNGFTITASEKFTNTWENGNDSHLIQILSASNVTVKNGKLVTTAKNKHGLNIYQSEGVVIEGLGIDHTLTRGGAPIVINASEVTVQGKLDLTVGESSWYGINVDPKGASASLAFAAESQVAMKNAEGVADEKVIIKTDNESAGLNISGTNAAGIPAEKIAGGSIEDGTAHVHKPATEWTFDGEYHWYACTGCAMTFEKAAHTFGEEEIVVDEEDPSKATAVHECDVCKYKEEVYGIRYISSVGQLSDAIRDQKAGEVWYIKPGTYTLTQEDLDKYATWKNPGNSPKSGWYFPIHVDNLSIIGETGENDKRVIITTDVVTPNGALPTQSFIAVWSDGVSIDNIDIKSKTVQNKAFEIFGKDFSLKNSKIMAVEYPEAEGKVYSDSIFFNPWGDDDSVGNAVLENIYMYAFISASYATAGNIDVSNITMDFSNNTWSKWGMGFGPALVGNIYGKVEGITYLVDNDAVWEEIISAASPYYGDTKAGTVIKFTEDITVDKIFDISRSDIVIDFDGHTLTASDAFTSTDENNSHLVQISGDNVTLKNAKIVTTSANKHGINIYQATGAVLENVTVDHTECTKGAPIVVNASEVTVKGALDLTVGENSWYGINVDPKEGTAALDFAEDSSLVMQGAKKPVMQVDGDDNRVEITGEENVGIETGEDGNYHKPTGEIKYDENGHWEVCESCDVKINPQSHRISAAWYYDGENHWHQCLDCGYMIDVAPHNAIHAVEDDPYFVSDATCTEGKKYYRSCECGCAGDETFTVGEPLGHKWETVPAKAPDCVSEGWNEHQACTVCGETEGKETVPALGHNLVKTDRKDADCVNAGNIEYYTCSTCGKIYRDADGTQEINKEQTVIAALGHRPGSFVVEREATCAQAGTQAKYCTVCNAEVEREEIPALAHTFGDWTVVKEATEKEKGQEERVCSVCQFKETRDIDALGGGLSTGAIVGIVIAVVVVLAGGGFCVYWFVIRKKS